MLVRRYGADMRRFGVDHHLRASPGTSSRFSPRGTDESGAEALAAELEAAVRGARVIVGNEAIVPSISIGVARHHGSETAEALMSRADRRMYDRKLTAR